MTSVNYLLVAVVFIVLLLQIDCNTYAFLQHLPSSPLLLSRTNNIEIERDRIKVYQLGNDYLDRISESSDDIERDSSESRSNPFANVIHAASSGITSAAERGSSDIQSAVSGVGKVTNSALSGVGKVTKRGTRDIKKTTIRAQKVIKKGAFGLVYTTTTVGKGLSDMHFFDAHSFVVGDNFGKTILNNNFASPALPKVEAEEIVKWIDSQAKSGTEWIDTKAKSGTEMVSSKARTLVLNFTGKQQYKFGDVTKEIIDRITSSEISVQDVILLLKILLALGATIGPIAELLPFTLLIEALNISLEQKVGGEILKVLSKTLDNRIVAAMFSDSDKSLIGDVMKRTVIGGVLSYTGKSTYESGDIQRAVEQRHEEDDDVKLEVDINSEFENWDEMFVDNIEAGEDQAKIMDMKIALALEECEALAQNSREKKGS